MSLNPDRLLPIEPDARAIARRLFAEVEHRPIISPHGHTEPVWYAENAPFRDPASLFVIPDHYIFRMLYSQGVPLEALGVPRFDGAPVEQDPRAIWRLFAAHYHLFRGTPSRLWFEHALQTVFDITERLSASNADRMFDTISETLTQDAMRPRALFERFGIDVIATTDSADDTLAYHDAIRASGWSGRVVPTYRPDAVVDPDRPGFRTALRRFVEMSGEAATFAGYLTAHRTRRAYFQERGATATDHGHPTADTADLSTADAEALFADILAGTADAEARALFRAQMLTEMARMSLDDGMVMQIHPGSLRNHNKAVFDVFGFDKGADIPTRTDYVHSLRPLLSAVGNEIGLTVILFTLDETAYARELAPLAGHYPALRLGPAWWFHDSPEGMRRFREMTTETAGFYNTVGFNDDTRAFLSIPARHDMARRVDCAFLARLVSDGRLDEDEAAQLALDLAGRLAKEAYKL
ncbi:glucuronate isomerase [Aureimonas altamirensis DSM 21988]|uniref:Uronate isomerase n=1 Tax=Aureimonas altamirensis DSM 21988 TaxID=1121026 RepID=A0ABY1IEM4_9HYPH|nr:glucuronate isomerase [Aureimonas altamirensis]SHJ06637.1 glucuronate isomerase [Aureimonas altamirensis DSM 21988]